MYKEILNHLINDGLIALPTETVYGLAGNAFSNNAVKNIYKIKERPINKSLIVHYHSLCDAEADVVINDNAMALAEAFWPGPMTLIMQQKKHSRISKHVNHNMKSLGIRIPNHNIALKILQYCGFPLAAPSANKYTFASPTQYDHVSNDFPNSDIMIIDGGISNIGIESTIIDVSGSNVDVIRSGFIDIDSIQSVLNIEVKYNKLQNISGQSDKHYSINKHININVTQPDENQGYIAFGPTNFNGKFCINLSKNGDLNEAARFLFSTLRQMNNISEINTVNIAPIPQYGIGIAINNRLSKM